VTRFLSQWHPVHPLDHEVESLVRDFLATRCETFSNNTITFVKKKRLAQNFIASSVMKAKQGRPGKQKNRGKKKKKGKKQAKTSC
jgi:hypothetical protein